jgi:glucose-1-phosphatase
MSHLNHEPPSTPDAPPKAVIFDLGKVLLQFDYSLAVARLECSCRIPLAEIQKLIDQSPLLYRFETNQLSSEQFFREICAVSGFCRPFEEFKEIFGDIFSPIDPMIALQTELRARGVPTFIFSNTNVLAIEHIRERYPFFHGFDGYILSCEEGAMKPDPVIYEAVEKRAGHSGAALLYIDDRPENIETGNARGWRSILHTDPETTRRAVAQAGLLL